MAKCRYCGESGWFLKITANGLCKACDPNVTRDILDRSRSLNDCLRAAEQSTGWASKVENYGTVLQHAEVLIKYEKRGIPTIEPLPSALLRDYGEKRDEVILTALGTTVKEAQSKADLADNYKEKFTTLSAALGEVTSYKNQISRFELLNGLASKLETLIRQLCSLPSLLTYVEQKHIIEDLMRRIAVARSNGDILDHLLLCGSFEPGKAALAREIAFEMGVNIKCPTVAAIGAPGDLAALLTNLDVGDVLLIEKIDSLKGSVFEVLIPAITDFQIDIMVGQGPAARSVQLPLKPFTLIGTTAKPSNVDRRLRGLMVVYYFADTKPTLGSLAEYVGQEGIKKDLKVRIDTAKRYSQKLPNLLLCGPREIGKATLADAIANEMQTNIQSSDATSLEKPEDLEDLLMSLQAGGLAIIERIELLKEPLVEILVQSIENPSIAIIRGKGPSTRNIDRDVDPKKFTLIGTTSRPSQVDRRLRRWMIVFDFVPYTEQEIGQIMQLIAKQEKLSIEPEAGKLLAECCEGSPGNARVLVKRLHDYVRAYNTDQITVDLAREAVVSFGYVGNLSTSTSLGSKLSTMDALEFEEFVANVFRELGYAVEITQGSGDHGIDLLMRKDRQVVVVQCKRWNAPVGEPIVRDFYGSLMSAGAQSGYVVTTGTFTSQAFSFVQGKPIQLVDLDALTDLVSRQVKDVIR